MIDAEDKFPHLVLPKVICLSCKRRLTVVIPANADLDEMTCHCGEQKMMRLQ